MEKQISYYTWKIEKIINFSKQAFWALNCISRKSIDQLFNKFHRRYWGNLRFFDINQRKDFFNSTYKDFYTLCFKNWINNENEIFSLYCDKIERFFSSKYSISLEIEELKLEFYNFS